MIDLFSEIVNKMKSPLDDDWGNDLRFASVVFIKTMLKYLQPEMGYDQVTEIYPELLKRLDDAQDGIRVETAAAFEYFFDSIEGKWSDSLYDYTVKQIFIHLDDPNQQIQQAINKVLQKAARVQTDKFLQIAESSKSTFSHPVLCQNLIDYAKEKHSA